MQIEVLDHVAGARAGARHRRGHRRVPRLHGRAACLRRGRERACCRSATIDEALALGAALSRARVLAGERHARRLPGFDAGNSPTEILALDLRGRALVHTTHAGTQGLVNAAGADEVLTGAFVNISAVVPLRASRARRSASRSCAWATRRASAAPRTTCTPSACVDCCEGGRRRSARSASGCATRRPPGSSSIRPATGRRSTISTTAPRSIASTSCCACKRDGPASRARSSERLRRRRRARLQRSASRSSSCCSPPRCSASRCSTHRTLEVAACGLGAIVALQARLHRLPRRARARRAASRHLAAEWVVLANLFCLLIGFALLSRHFEQSHVPRPHARTCCRTTGAAGSCCWCWCSCCRASSTTSPRR